MHSEKRVVARGDTGDRPEFHDSSPRNAAVVQAEKASAFEHDDLRGERRGGRRLSAQVGVADVLGGPTSRDAGAEEAGRQNRLLDRPPVSAVAYGRLKDLARARVRRVVRELGFDWEKFLAGGPEWSLTEVVHRKAVQEAARRGLDVRPTDVPTDTVLKAVRRVLEEMDADAALRPSQGGFCAEQARRGELGRQAQSVEARAREMEVMALVASGVTNNAEIARRLKISASTPGRIRKRVAERERAAAEEVQALEWVFPAEDVPAHERWPATQFVMETQVYLDESQARWICDMGRCYEAEGRVGELMYAIGKSAGAVVNAWAYLQAAVAHRGDAWTVKARLLGNVLEWAGEKSLRYSLDAIADGYVRRPLPYLERVLQVAVASGRGERDAIVQPVAAAVAMARKLVPALDVVDVEDVVDAEREAAQTGYVEDYRRRHSRLPWEGEIATVNVGKTDCIGLKGYVADDSFKSLGKKSNLESSPRSHKANARTAEAAGQRDFCTGGLAEEKSEHGAGGADLGDFGEIGSAVGHGESLKIAGRAWDLLPRQNPTGILEQTRCPHRLVGLLVSGMDVESVELVECAEGCGHRLYSDRGALECPCHWAAAKASQVARALQEGNHMRAEAADRSSESLEVKNSHLRLERLPWASKCRSSGHLVPGTASAVRDLR